jgi:hypothetical protein
VISLTGLMVAIAGDAGRWNGFSDREGNSTIGDLVWTGFALGALVALVTGLVALGRGRRSAREAETRAGKLGVASFAVAVLVAVVVSVVLED